MRTVLTTVIVTGLLFGGCTDDADPGPAGTFEPIGDGPAGIEDVVQHLVDPPEYPVAIDGDPELVELRSEDLARRHHVYLAEAAGPAVEDELVRGSVLRVGADQQVEFDPAVSVAELDGASITGVEDCPAPCQVSGPALVAPQEWFQSIRVAAGWQLVEPAPTE